MVLVLDGPMGSELSARGVNTALPLWSAGALRTDPDVVSAIHAAYADAGAVVHTTNTFRTKRRTADEGWESLTRTAVGLALNVAIPLGHRVAGSIAPLEDCYRPDLSPADPEPEHRELAQALADAGCDVLICETFPHVGEALSAVRAAVSTGLETWVGFTAGPNGDLLTPRQMAEAAQWAVQEGAAAVFVNCTPASMTLPFVQALLDAVDVPVGAYANAGSAEDAVGWRAPEEPGVAKYIELARTWIAAGAVVVGSCCGTGPAHVRALAALDGGE